MIFDTHAHMDDRAFDQDRDSLLSRLPEEGIALLMMQPGFLPGCRKSFQSVQLHLRSRRLPPGRRG